MTDAATASAEAVARKGFFAWDVESSAAFCSLELAVIRPVLYC